MASETGILYVAVMRIPKLIRHVVKQLLSVFKSPLLNCEHEQGGVLPRFLSAANREIVWRRFSFWKIADNHVTTSGPFRPFKLFKHSSHYFYSKAKGVVDGATKKRAILRCATSKLSREQKIVS